MTKRAILLTLLAALGATAVLRLHVGETFGWPEGALGQAIAQLFLGEWLIPIKDVKLEVMDLRLFRLVAACLVGVALASGGVALQSLLRNPLAEPFILGLSSGAAVGVMAQALISQATDLQVGARHTGALAGALVTMGIVYLVARRKAVLDPLGLLLVGVVLSTINGALLMLLAFLAPPALRLQVMNWSLGYIDEGVGSINVLVITLATVAGVAVLYGFGRAMDVASFSDAEAVSLGVNLTRLRTLLFLIASALAAGAVVLAGPIAFVGLICPHITRLLLGPSHRPLLIGAAITGALLILWADMATVWLDLNYGRMPIGVFTAMLGGPIFLWMLRPFLGRGVG